MTKTDIIDIKTIEYSCPIINEVLDRLIDLLDKRSYKEIENLMENIRNINSELREAYISTVYDLEYKLKRSNEELSSLKKYCGFSY